MPYDNKETAFLEALGKENGEITYADAVTLGVNLDKSTRSVIAKVLSLEIPYVPKPVPEPKAKGPTKAQLVAEVEARLSDEDFAPNLDGLEKANATALANLVAAL